MFQFPQGNPQYPIIDDFLIDEELIPANYFASEYIRNKRKQAYKGIQTKNTTIWHENKSGNISALPYSCALRAGASHNYLLVNGIRRLLPRELLRLQGFPDSYKIVVSDSQCRKQAGNSLPVNTAQAVISELLKLDLINENTKIANSRKIQASLSIEQVS